MMQIPLVTVSDVFKDGYVFLFHITAVISLRELQHEVISDIDQQIYVYGGFLGVHVTFDMLSYLKSASRKIKFCPVIVYTQTWTD